MLHASMGKNVAAHKAPKRQEEEAAAQGKMSTGRAVIWQNRMTIQTSGQMAGASSTFRRTISPHSGATHSEAVLSRAVKRPAGFPTEAVSAKRPKKSETTSHQRLQEFKEQVDNAVRQLHKERENAPDDLSFCTTVIDTYKALDWNLDNMVADMTSDDYNSCLQYSVSEMSVLYNANLDKVLNFFQDQIDNGQGWMYAGKLDKVTRGFCKLGDRSAAHNMAVLKDIWNLNLNKELDYLQYLKGSPDSSYSAGRAVDNIDWLTSFSSPSYTLGLMSDRHKEKITQQAKFLYQEIIHSDVHHSDAGKKEENGRHRTTDIMMEKRKHHDLIHKQLDKLHKHYGAAHGSGHAAGPRFNYLKRLFELYKKYNKLIDNPHTQLFWKLNRMIMQLVNEVQNKLKRGAYDNRLELKAEVSAWVDDLKKEKWLNKEQKRLSFNFMQLQSTVLPGDREDRVMYGIIHQDLDDISTILHNEGLDSNDYLIALKRFKQLVDKYEDKLDKIPKDKAKGIRSRLTAVRTVFFSKLFAPIFNDYNRRCKKAVQDIERSCTIMRRHKDKLVKLNPYASCVFIPSRNKPESTWQWAACFAWLDDLKHLSHQTSFSEDDVDNLLGLKDIVLTPPLHLVKNHLRTILKSLFPFMLQANPDTALIGNVTKLSEWVDNLHSRNIDQTLNECNEKWREKYVSKAGGRATTSSDASAARMPSSVRPGISSTFPKAFDCPPPWMRLQNAPHMRQSSIPCPAVPTPAPCGASRQPESSIPCRTPNAQSATESRPLPPPGLIDQPFPPRIPPAPAHDRVDFHQPVCRRTPPRWRQTASQQQYEPRRSTMPFEYRSRYPSSSNTR